MEVPLNKFLKTTALCMAMFGLTPVAMADDYPSKPIRIVNPWPPGDLEDVLGRIFASRMQDDFGVPAKLVNVVGGGGVIGVNEVVTAEPDGHTMGVFVGDFLTLLPILGNVPFESSDMEPVGIYLTYPFILAARADAPYNNLEELAAYAKDHDVSLGHFGYEIVPTLSTFDVAKGMGFEFASDAAFDMVDCSVLLSGDADLATTTSQIVMPCIDSGEVKPIAAYSGERISLFPDVGTLAEQTGMDIPELWNGVFVPKGTPQEVKDKIAAVIQSALRSEEAVAVGAATGARLFWVGGEEAQAWIDRDYALIEDMVAKR
jgi:tripartite-type tricarboxylate transporter receptor subunit TctC